MLRTNLPEKADLEMLGDGVYEVLESVGAMFQNEEILRALEAAGARVDYAAEVARFPKRMQRQFVREIRREHRTARDNAATNFHGPGLPMLEVQVAQYIYDSDAGERRPGRASDLIELVKLGDVLHGESGVGHCLLVQDVPPILEPLQAALLLAEYAHRPSSIFAWNVAQEPYLVAMADIMGIPHWHNWGAVCIAHPLRFDRVVADRYVKMMRAGQRAGLTAMPVVGLSTPVTPEGFIVVASAELLASWIAGRALNPEVSLGGSMWAGTADMKTGQVSFSAFDAMFYGIAVVQFLKEWCGVSVGVGGGEYSAAKEPGLYAALEKAHKAMTIAAFTGQHPGLGQGMLDSGKVLSEVQLLIEREYSAGLQQYARPIAPTAESIGMETIREIGLGLHSSYFQSDHTAHHFRRCLWIPEGVNRTGWAGFAEETQILDRTREKARALRAQYQKPEGREAKLAALQAIFEKAKRDLL